jgi:hypothetical protein
MPSILPGFFALALLTLSLAAGATAAAPVAPFSATYEVRRNGDLLGEATLRLARDGNGWRFTQITRGTQGLAQIAGVRIDESSRFRYLPDGRPETTQYDYAMRTRFNDRRRGARVLGGDIEFSRGDERWRVPHIAGAVDRQLLTVVLMQAVTAGRSGLQTVQVVGRGAVEPQAWAIGRLEPVPGVDGKGRRVERIRETPDGRSTVLWLKADADHVPLRIEQREDDGEIIEMRLLRRG